MEQATPGMQVVGVHGLAIGVVEATEAGCLRVAGARVGGGLDRLWLRASAVATVDEDGVTLVCTAQNWKRFECRRAGHHAAGASLELPRVQPSQNRN